MKYLLDTCLLSELVRPAPNPAVLEWMGARTSADLFVSALTLAELERGIVRLSPSRRQSELATWLASVQAGFGQRTLAFTRDTAGYWARLCAQAEGYAERVQRRAAASRERAARSSSARDHFNAAAALGQHDALLLLADRYGDDSFFDLQAPQVRADPLWIAELAQRVGRYEWTPAWLTLAAEHGDMRAMRELMESWHADDPLKVWTWFHYAKLLGTDLTQGDYEAIHEDGSSYDDDVGGPVFVDGVDGIELPTADESVRQEALRAAHSLYA